MFFVQAEPQGEIMYFTPMVDNLQLSICQTSQMEISIPIYLLYEDIKDWMK